MQITANHCKSDASKSNIFKHLICTDLRLICSLQIMICRLQIRAQNCNSNMNKHGKTRATQRNSALLKTQKSGLKATQTRTSMVKHMQLSATQRN
jgi:hypothetical protein